MNGFMLVLLLLILVSIVILFVYLLSTNKNMHSRMLLENQENRNTNARFDSILSQIQSLYHNQVHSLDTLDLVQEQVQGMAQVMMNTKRRGNWGEYQLNHLLSNYLGENKKIYSVQYTLPNGKIADVALHLPNTKQVLCIDSKFPMENYLRMEKSEENKDHYLRLFVQNVKKHIDDIANKYINSDTSAEALMFIPSEAIYQFICGQCDSLLAYALKKHVLITSPTTLIGILFSLQASTQDFYRASHLDQIEKELFKLKEDVDRLQERVHKANQSMESALKQLQLTQISANKISNRFETMIEGKEKYDFYD